MRTARRPSRTSSHRSSTTPSTSSTTTASRWSTCRSNSASGCCARVLREHDFVRYGSHIETDGEDFYEAVKKQGLEGLVAKLKSSPYEPGRRSKAWLKIKIRREQEAIVVGYEPGKGSRADLGSLILAVYDGKDRLRYVGEVGSGLTERTIRQLKSELDEHRLDTPPVFNPPRIRGAVWSEPRLVVRVEFTEWTTDGYLRQAAYKGLDIGKDPRTVVRERELPADQTAATAEKEAKRAARTVDTPGKPAADHRQREPSPLPSARQVALRSERRRRRPTRCSSRIPTTHRTRRRLRPRRRWPRWKR